MVSNRDARKGNDDLAAADATDLHRTVRAEGESELDRPATALLWSGLAAGLAGVLAAAAAGLVCSLATAFFAAVAFFPPGLLAAGATGAGSLAARLCAPISAQISPPPTTVKRKVSAKLETTLILQVCTVAL